MLRTGEGVYIDVKVSWKLFFLKIQALFFPIARKKCPATLKKSWTDKMIDDPDKMFNQKRARKSFLTITVNQAASSGTTNNLTDLSIWKNITFNLKVWGHLGIKRNGTAHKSRRYELSHNVKVKRSNLAGGIPMSYSAVTTGPGHGRTLEWGGQAIFQSDRHIQQNNDHTLGFTFTLTNKFERGCIDWTLKGS